jgi:hypothetical protein
VSVRLRKRQDEFGNRMRRKTYSNESNDKDLQLGADPGPLHRTIRRALLEGCTLGANRLEGTPTSSRRLDGC